jgi:hypothetical protein
VSSLSDYAGVLAGIADSWKGAALTTNEPATAQLRAALADLFLAARASAAQRLQEAGLYPTTEVERTIIERERNGPGSWGTATRREMRNTLAVLGPTTSHTTAPWLTAADVDQVRDCASRLLQVTATLPFWNPLGAAGSELIEKFEEHTTHPSYADNPAEWIMRSILLPALWWHLRAMPSLEVRDDSTALVFADEILQVTLDEYLRYRVLVPLSGIVLPSSSSYIFAEGDISIRSLSDGEQGDWFMEYGHSSGQSLMNCEAPRVVLEVPVSGPRTAQHIPVGGPAPLLVLALQLHGFEIAGCYAPEYCDPRWIQSFTYPVPITLPGRTKTPTAASELTAEKFSAVVGTAHLLDRHNVSQPRSPQDLALHRFVLGVARSNLIDALLDFTIALEALLLPDDSRGDLGYRFRIHGAHYLAREPCDREGAAEQLQEIYRMRSRLVHGGKYPDQARIAAMHDTAREYVRRGLLRAVHEGFPSSEVFAQMALGIAPS